MAYTTVGYWETVKAIASEAVEEYPDANDQRDTLVSEGVHDSEYIVWYHANEVVLEASDNEPDGPEVQAMCADNAYWRTMRMTAARMAMETDVNGEVGKLDEERAEAEENAA